jgi:hypothetical protein
MKAILVALLVLTLGASGVFAAGPLGDDASTDRTIPLTTGAESSIASSTTTTETGEDVPGPCDEPKHANDPRCVAGAVSTGGTTTTEPRRSPRRTSRPAARSRRRKPGARRRRTPRERPRRRGVRRRRPRPVARQPRRPNPVTTAAEAGGAAEGVPRTTRRPAARRATLAPEAPEARGRSATTDGFRAAGAGLAGARSLTRSADPSSRKVRRTLRD